MSHIHLNLGNDLLKAEVRAHIACLAHQLPSADFNLLISGAALAALLGNTGDLMVNTPIAAPKAVGEGLTLQPGSPKVEAPFAPTPLPPAPAPQSIASVEGEKRFRRTKAETEAGLSVEQAQAFRTSGLTDAVAYAASLVGAAEDAVDATLAAASPPPPPPPPPPSPPAPPADTPKAAVTEQDVRDAARIAVQGGKKDGVQAVAAEFGVKNWKELDASKYAEVLTKLTALMVVG